MLRRAWVSLVLLLACTASPEPATAVGSMSSLTLAPRQAPRMRVATFNVNFGVAGRLANTEALEEIDADVVLLQETTPEAELRFRDALAERYPNMLFRDCCRAGGLGVLSKHPIAWETHLESQTGWFPAWIVAVDGPLGRVQLLDVHLRPPVSDSGSWVEGYFTTGDDRREEIESFWTAVQGELPIIVAGDFNEGPDGAAVRFLADRGLRSALAEVDPDATTWHWPLQVGELTSMLDHIAYGPRLSLLHTEVRTLGVSDHYPVVADFTASPR